MNISAMRGLLLGLGLLGSIGTAVADEPLSGPWYAGAIFYSVRTGDDRHVDDHNAVGAFIGKDLSTKWSFEVAYNEGHFDGKAGFDELRISALSADFQRHFYRDSRIHPYFTVGLVGSDESRASTGDYQRIMLQAGMGLLANLHSDADGLLQLRLEAKGRWHESWISDPNQGQPSDFLMGVGLQYHWGGVRPVAQVKELVVPPPAPEPAAAPPPPKDSDGDGVPDDLDRCPNTPAGVKVDSTGCPLDSDHDGVPDYLDKCPATPAGVKVDANGCEIEAIVLKGVNFDFDSAKLTGSSTAVLDDVVALLKQRPGVPATIGGHTDSKGKHGYNMRLSERRATAVRDYLVAHGIPASSLSATGYGETLPIASNSTEEGRAQNRRVTLEFKRLDMK